MNSPSSPFRLVAIAAAALAFTAAQIPSASSAASATTAATVSALDASEIQFSYEKLRADFYRKTDPQSIADGARAAIASALKTAGVRASLPPIFANADPVRTSKAIDHEVDVAARAAHGKVSPHAIAYAAITGILDSVHDKYTVFLDPKDFAALNEGLDGTSFAGTGIVIQADDATKLIDVSNIVPDGPADKAGIQQDDVILAIDGLSTKGLTIQQASSHLRGKAGTQVHSRFNATDRRCPHRLRSRGRRSVRSRSFSACCRAKSVTWSLGLRS